MVGIITDLTGLIDLRSRVSKTDMKYTTAPLLPGIYYHIYNRGNNQENLFIEKRNYPYFLSLYAKHIEPIADTFAYCLLRNHFHISVRIKTEEEYQQSSQVLKTCEDSKKKFNPSQSFSNLFNAYAKAINKGYGRQEAYLKNDLVESQSQAICISPP